MSVLWLLLLCQAVSIGTVLGADQEQHEDTFGEKGSSSDLHDVHKDQEAQLEELKDSHDENPRASHFSEPQEEFCSVGDGPCKAQEDADLTMEKNRGKNHFVNAIVCYHLQTRTEVEIILLMQ